MVGQMMGIIATEESGENAGVGGGGLRKIPLAREALISAA